MPLNFAATNDVIHSLDRGVLSVTINREAKRNPLSLGVLQELRQVFALAANDGSIALAILTGAVLSVLCALFSIWRMRVFEFRRSGGEQLPLGQGGGAALLVFPVSTYGAGLRL